MTTPKQGTDSTVEYGRGRRLPLRDYAIMAAFFLVSFSFALIGLALDLITGSGEVA